GRPKGSRNVKAHILEELNKKVVVQLGGRPRKVSKAQIVALKAVDEGMRGRDRATDRLLDLDRSNEDEHILSTAEQQREDKLIMERFIERLRAEIHRQGKR